MATAVQTLPVATGEWEIDSAHTTLGFVAKHLMVTKVRGHFQRFQGSIRVGDTLETTKAEATIDAGSLMTNDPKRDGHLKSADFFDVEKYPEIRFVSTKIEPTGENTFRVTGDFTIRDVTKPITLDAEFQGMSHSPMGFDVAFFTATTEIDREEWGLTWNVALEQGGVLVSKKIQIEIEGQAKPKQPAA